MEKAKANRILPWVYGILVACAAFLSIACAVQGESLRALAFAVGAVALMIRGK